MGAGHRRENQGGQCLALNIETVQKKLPEDYKDPRDSILHLRSSALPAFKLAHPDVERVSYSELHQKFIEKLNRDIFVHGRVSYVELAEVRLKSEEIFHPNGRQPPQGPACGRPLQ